MPQEELRLEVVLDDKATEQLVRLRVEMQKLTGSETHSGMEKLQKQAEALQKKFIPLYETFSNVTGSVKTLVTALGPMAFGITVVGTAAAAASTNVLRFIEKMADLGQLMRETQIPPATIQNIRDALLRAGVAPDAVPQFIRGLSADVSDIMKDSSQLVVELRARGRLAGDEGQRNTEELIEGLRKSFGEKRYAEGLNRIIRGIQNVWRVDPGLGKEFSEMFRMPGAEAIRNIERLADATAEENKEAEESTQQAEAFNEAVETAKKNVGALLNEIARATIDIEKLTEFIKTIAEVLELTAEFLKGWEKWTTPTPLREYGGMTQEQLQADEGMRGRLYRGRRRGRVLPTPEALEEPQKQSFIGGDGFGALVMKAKFEENTDRLEDDTKARHDLLNQLIILNDFFRGRFGGGGAPGRTTITTPDGAQIVTSPRDRIAVADALVETPDASILAYDPSGPIYQPGVPSRAGGHHRLDLPYSLRPGTSQAIIPAAERYRNPAAQYPSAAASEFGMQYWGETGPKTTPGHRQFPTVAHGLAVNFDNMYRLYAGKTADEIGHTWTGHISRGIPGIDPQKVITKEDLQNPETAIDIFKRMAYREKGGKTDVTEDEFRAGHEAFMDKVRRTAAQAGQPFPKSRPPGAPASAIMLAQMPGEAGGDLGDLRGLDLGEPDKWRGGGISLDGLDRAMGNEMNHMVEGTGKIDVEVAAPKKVSGNGKSDSLLRKSEFKRQIQMAPAEEGTPRFL